MKKQLVLASGSAIRKTLLDNAGLDFKIIPADIDEETIRVKMETETPDISPLEVAECLAREKARHISLQNPDAYVIGSDQILALESEIMGKPENLELAFERLLKLSGKTHQLHTAVSVVYQGIETWSYAESVHMTMRELKPEYIRKYLAEAGEEVCKSVGAYKLESLGVQLFSKIEGNYFTILGICLLPLLTYLREEGIIES